MNLRHGRLQHGQTSGQSPCRRIPPPDEPPAVCWCKRTTVLVMPDISQYLSTRGNEHRTAPQLRSHVLDTPIFNKDVFMANWTHCIGSNHFHLGESFDHLWIWHLAKPRNNVLEIHGWIEWAAKRFRNQPQYHPGPGPCDLRCGKRFFASLGVTWYHMCQTVPHWSHSKSTNVTYILDRVALCCIQRNQAKTSALDSSVQDQVYISELFLGARLSTNGTTVTASGCGTGGKRISRLASVSKLRLQKWTSLLLAILITQHVLMQKCLTIYLYLYNLQHIVIQYVFVCVV